MFQLMFMKKIPAPGRRRRNRALARPALGSQHRAAAGSHARHHRRRPRRLRGPLHPDLGHDLPGRRGGHGSGGRCSSRHLRIAAVRGLLQIAQCEAAAYYHHGGLWHGPSTWSAGPGVAKTLQPFYFALRAPPHSNELIGTRFCSENFPLPK